MTNTIESKIDNTMAFAYNFVDFFYAYCANKGINNPEEDLTDEQYAELEEECKSKINLSMLDKLSTQIDEEILFRISEVMK